MGRKVTKNFEEDGLITSPKEIIDLANKRKSVYVTVWKRTSPASFLLSWQLRLIMRFIENKRLYKIKRIKK